ncbi:unnamed protein product [Clonostachys rosea f. rosea IK726]|uniref:Uncharacterized protein n=1 Tax=Clonostachys rosea f. rosea IK726 TaxID=1349383 RepID=A0ACA9T8T0_BIOOC|nr:unnamed protein product [Clonostachys rosea f. rosea IK726]
MLDKRGDDPSNCDDARNHPCVLPNTNLKVNLAASIMLVSCHRWLHHQVKSLNYSSIPRQSHLFAFLYLIYPPFLCFVCGRACSHR